MPNNLLKLSQIFNDCFFEVPDYQRGYAWEDSQVNDLIEDIERISKKKHMHYTGTIVITPKIGIENTFEIVDGQQRLTTLIIFLKAIYNSDPKYFAWLKKKFFLKGRPGNEKQILKLSNEYNTFFRDFVLQDKCNISPQNKYEENLKNTKILFAEYLDRNKANIIYITDSILRCLGFLLFETKNDKEIGIMFEVINNRGKELSELEKIKNYFIYYSTIFNKEELRKIISEKWIKIIDYLSKAEQTSIDNENSFLRNCYLVFFEANKTKSWNVYKEVKVIFNVNDKNEIDEKVSKIEDFVRFLETAALSYAYFYNGSFFNIHYNGQIKGDFIYALKTLRCHPVNASIMPLYLVLMNELNVNNNEIKIRKLLEVLEKVNFRIYILPKITNRADSKQGDLFLWANEFYHKREWNSKNDPQKYYSKYNNKLISGDIFDWLKIELEEFTKSFCSEEKFIQALTLDIDEPDDFMDWNGLRFLLAAYEESLQKCSGHSWDIENIKKDIVQTKDYPNDYLSREHIWAKENMSEHFDENYIQKRRLGNFILLGLSKNKSLGKLGITEKIDKLVSINASNKGEAHLFQIEKLTKIFTISENYLNKLYSRKTKNYYENLSKLINDKRETEIIMFALIHWKFDNEIFTRFKKIDSFYNNNSKHNYILN